MLTTWTVRDGRCRVREGAISDITAALPEPARESAAEVAETENLRSAVWIDLLNPTPAEERADFLFPRLRPRFRARVPARRR